MGTDGGVYGTLDRGESWERLGNNMPMIPVYDLDWNEFNNELIAGTHGRSLMTFPLDSLGVEPMDSTVVNTRPDPIIANEIKIFPSPATDQITLSFSNIEPGKGYQLVIYDQSGKVLENRTEGYQPEVNMQLDVSQYPAGQYFVKVRNRHRVISGTFVKQ